MIRFALLFAALTIAVITVAACEAQTLTVEEPLTSCNLPIVAYSGFVSPLSLGLDIPFDVDIIQNQGQICVSDADSDPSTSSLEFIVQSSGCYSSTCSLNYERNGEMYIDRVTKTIQFFSRFMVKDYGGLGGCVCSADCGGAGQMVYMVDELPEGTYQIKLGLKTIGELSVPFGSVSGHMCFSTETNN